MNCCETCGRAVSQPLFPEFGAVDRGGSDTRSTTSVAPTEASKRHAILADVWTDARNDIVANWP